MKSIILAAVEAQESQKFQKLNQKSLRINKQSLISRQINYLRKLKINKITVVRGYKKKFISFKSINYVDNKKFKHNEQLDSLFTAKKELNDEIIILFSDIIYDFKDLKKIFLSKKGEITIGVDKNWKKRYKSRFDHPVHQADKVKLNMRKQVIKIGKKLKLNETHAEFLGIIKLTKIGCKIFNYNYIKSKIENEKMQIHDFLDFIIRKGVKVNTSDISGKYMEIDTFNDFKLAKKMFEIS